MVQINWTFQARDDLKNIAEYISLDSVKYAKLQVARIKLRTHVLKNQIRSGKITPEINDPDIRELIEGNYRIIYKIQSSNKFNLKLIITRFR
jgi:toxin ParE1/3/4